MKKLRYLIILFAIILGSCAPQDTSPSPEKPEEMIGTVSFKDPSTISIFIDCVDGFNAPKIISPYLVIIDPSPPHTFNWSISCNLDEYIIAVYPQKVGAQAAVILDGFVSSNPQYTSNVQLDPATTYRWTVTAISDVGTEESMDGWFTTGPVCDPGDLVAPTLISPADGSFEKGKGWGNTHEVYYTTSYPTETCTPDLFFVDFSLNPDFTGVDYWNVGGYHGPYSTVEDGMLIYGSDTNTLKDCEFDYWRAQAFVGDDFGPFSETFSFYTDFEGECMVVSKFKAILNANCRSDPWVGKNYLGIIREGETAMLLGLNEDASWGNFRLDNDIECWVNMKTVEMQPPGAIFNPRFYQVLEHTLPPEDAPLPPEDAPPPQEDDQQGCIAPDRGGDLVCQIPCPDPSYAARVCSR